MYALVSLSYLYEPNTTYFRSPAGTYLARTCYRIHGLPRRACLRLGQSPVESLKKKKKKRTYIASQESKPNAVAQTKRKARALMHASSEEVEQQHRSGETCENTCTHRRDAKACRDPIAPRLVDPLLSTKERRRR